MGANNRLDFSGLVTTGVNKSEVINHQESLLGFLEGWPEDETHDPAVPAISHSRGLSACVFVPFNEVMLLCFATSIPWKYTSTVTSLQSLFFFHCIYASVSF